jgi:tetratricopeptide (TPR) repeat protein
VKETPQGPVFSETLPSEPEIKVPEVYEEDTTTAKEAVRAFNDGDWPEAVRLFGEAFADSPDDEILKHNLAHSLASMAWQEYKDEDFSGAGRHFTEAIGLEKNPTFYKRLAYARLKQDDLEGAAAALEEIKTDPEAKGLLKSIYSNLGDQHYRSGELDEAIGYFERSLAIDPGDKGIKQALRRLRGENEVEARFRTREGSHFVVRFEGGVNSVTGNVIAILLEEAYFKVGAVLYSMEEFRDTTRSPSWVGALYDGRIKIPAGGITERTDVLEKVIFHEYTHAVVHRLSGGKAPVWLNEGRFP